MKKLLTIAVLAMLLAACHKHDAAPPPSLSGNLLSSFWSYMPDLGFLFIDSLQYDEQERLATLKFFQYPDVNAMTSPAFDAVRDDSAVFTFNYQGQDTLPVSYHLLALKEQQIYEEDHSLTYDGQRRLISDSVKGVTGNEIDGYSPTYFNVRVTRYAYQGNLIVANNYACDLGTFWDSSWVNSNGNVSEMHSWSDKMFATPDGLSFKMMTANYSDLDNPFYRVGIFRGSFYAGLVLGSQTYTTMSKKMELGSTYIVPNASADLHTTLQWVSDDRHRVIGGEYKADTDDPNGPSSRTVYAFHYR
jgi:hypothetical protein